jgi:AcrR family transcriptional regulator
MTKRMKENKSPETSVTEVRLVEAAAQCFARKGFKATNTKEIAMLADLNEGTLFRYFPRKIDMFFAALDSHLARIKLSRDLQISLAANEDPAVVLPRIVATLLNTLAAQPQLQRLLHVASFELPETRQMIQGHFGPIFDELTSYFKRSAEKGSIRDVEPSLTTLGLFGTVLAHHQFCKILTTEYCFPPDIEGATAAYASLWLHALVPELSPTKRSSEPLDSQAIIFPHTAA